MDGCKHNWCCFFGLTHGSSHHHRESARAAHWMVRAWLSRVSPRIVHLWCWISMNLKYHLEELVQPNISKLTLRFCWFPENSNSEWKPLSSSSFLWIFLFRSHHQCPLFSNPQTAKQPNSPGIFQKKHRSASPADSSPLYAWPHAFWPGFQHRGWWLVTPRNQGTPVTPRFCGSNPLFLKDKSIKSASSFSCWMFVAGWIMLNPYLGIEHSFLSWLIVVF